MQLINTYEDVSVPKTVFTFFINYSVYVGPTGQDVLSKFPNEQTWLNEYPYYRRRTNDIT
jgi:hypothetical protein